MQPHLAEPFLFFPRCSFVCSATPRRRSQTYSHRTHRALPHRQCPIAEARACRVPAWRNFSVLARGNGLGRQRWGPDPLPNSGPSHSKSGIRVRRGAGPAPATFATRHRGATHLRHPTSALQTTPSKTATNTQVSIRALRLLHLTEATSPAPISAPVVQVSPPHAPRTNVPLPGPLR